MQTEIKFPEAIDIINRNKNPRIPKANYYREIYSYWLQKEEKSLRIISELFKISVAQASRIITKGLQNRL